jgi:hypothetical protein
MIERRSLPRRVIRKFGRGKAKASAWLTMFRHNRWQSANAANSQLFADRLQRSTAAPPQAILDQLQHDFKEYITVVSKGSMAASWEFVSLLVRLLSTGAFGSVVDIGSGFTSYTTRYWRQHANASLKVASVDDSSAWLEKTRAYLIHKGLPGDQLFLEQNYIENGSRPRADLLIYDYSLFDQRTLFLPQIEHFISPGSIILFDDYQLRPDTARYHSALDKWVFEHSLQLVDLKPQTLDKHGRYAVMGYNPRASNFKRLLELI